MATASSQIIIEKIYRYTNVGTNNSPTININVPAPGCLVLIGIALNNHVVATAVKVNGNNTTLQGTALDTNSAGDHNSWYTYQNPKIGNGNVSITGLGGATGIVVYIISGASLNSPNYVTAILSSNSTNPMTKQIQVPTAGTLLVQLGINSANNQWTADASETVVYNQDVQSAFHAWVISTYKMVGAGIQSMTENASGSQSCMIIIAIPPAHTGSIWYPNIDPRNINDVVGTAGLTIPIAAPGADTLDSFGVHSNALFFKNSFLHTIGRIAIGIGVPAPNKQFNENLVSYWGLDEGIGTTINDALHNNPGQMVLPNWISRGKINNAAVFNGGDNNITIPDAVSLDPTGAITVSAWFYAGDNSWASGNNRRVLQKGNSDNQYRILAESGFLKWTFHIGAVDQVIQAPLPSSNAWHHAVGTYDGQTSNFYIDNTLVGTLATSGPINTTTDPLFIGSKSQSNGSGVNGDNWLGFLDSIAIWSRALSGAEVSKLWNNGRGLTYPFLGNSLGVGIQGYTPYQLSNGPYWQTSFLQTIGRITVGKPGPSSISVSDSSTVTESVTVILKIPNINVNDASTVTDVVTQVLETDNVNVNDVSAVTDTQGYALLFDGSHSYVDLGTMGTWGSSFGSGFYAKFDIKTNSTGGGVIAGFDVGTTGFIVAINMNFNFSNQKGGVYLQVEDDTGKLLKGGTGTTVDTGLADGNWHTVTITATPSTNTIVINVDGTGYTVSYALQQTPATFTNFGAHLYMGGYDNGLANPVTVLNGAIDNLSMGTNSSTLFGSYVLNEGSGTTTADGSGHSNTGTLSGSTKPVWVSGNDTPTATVRETDFINVNDSSAVTESTTPLETDFINVNDSSAVTESTTVEEIYLINVSDSSTVTNVITQILETDFINVNDSSTVTDVITQILETDFINVNDSSAVTESTTPLEIDLVNVNDSSAVTESTTVIEVTCINVSDSSTVTDVITQVLERDFINVNDSSAVTESITPLEIDFVNVNDASTVTENSTVIEVYCVNVSDSSAVTDVITQILDILDINVFDSSAVTDVLVQDDEFAMPFVVDSSTVTDVLTQILEKDNINVFDSSTVTESITMQLIGTINVNDSSAVTENIQVLETSFVNINDSSAVTENSQVLDILDINVFDSSAVTESVSVLAFSAIFISVGEDSVVTDVIIQILETDFINVNNASVVTESSQVLETSFVSVNDSSTVTDVLTQVVEVNVLNISESSIPSDTGYALQFDATQNWVSVADNSSLDPTGNFTVEATIINTGGGTQRTIVRKDNQYILRVSSGKLQGVIWTTNNTALQVAEAISLPAGKHHVAISYDGATFWILRDGAVVASHAATGATLTSTGVLGIGATGASSEPFGGTIDEVRISNIARYVAAYSVPNNPLVSDASTSALWHFDEGSGTTTIDSSGNGNTGTLNGSPLPTWVIGFDAAQVEFIDFINVNDSSTVTDVLIQEEDILDINVSDSSSVTESSQVLETSFININDSSTVTESTTPLEIDFINVNDVSTVTDVLIQEENILDINVFETVLADKPYQYAIQFDGTNDYLSVTSGQSALNATTALTMEAWVNQATRGRTQVIMCKGDGNTSYNYQMSVDGVNFNQIFIGGGDYPTFNYQLPLNTWTHIVYTFDNVNHKLYINGSLNQVIASSVGIGSTNTSPFYIGWNNYPNQKFNGALDEVRVYTRAISAAEVTQHYYDSYINNTALQAYFSFNENTGTNAGDSSPNALVANFSGAPTWILDTNPGLPQVQLTDFVNVNNASVVTESTIPLEIELINISDSSTATDVVSVLVPIYYINVEDDSSVFDMVIEEDILNVTVIDSSTVTDVLPNSPAVTPLNINVFDSSTVTENLNFNEGPAIFAGDDSVVTESITLLEIDFVSVSDSSAVTDLSNVTQVYCINVFESSTVTDVLVQEEEVLDINVFDSSNVNDGLTGQNGGIYLNPIDLIVYDSIGPFKFILVDGQLAIQVVGFIYTLL